MATATGITAEQLWSRGPDGRCELVRGDLRVMSPAGSQHGWVVMNVAAPLAAFVRQQGLGYVFGAETGFVVQRCPDSVRAPDVACARLDRASGGLPSGFFEGPPDIAVEVVSPSETGIAVDEQVKDWLASGCLDVWVIDPQRRGVSLHTRTADKVVRQPVTQLTSNLLPGFALPVEPLFVR